MATEILYKKAKDKVVHLAQKVGQILSKESAILKTAEGFEAKIGHDVAENLSKMAADKSKPHGCELGKAYTYKNGKFDGVKYHHQNSHGPKNGINGKSIKSPAPNDGQAALDNSVVVKDKGHFERRVGTSNGEIVVLDGSVKDGFHGSCSYLERINF